MSKIGICCVVLTALFLGFTNAGSLQAGEVSSKPQEWYAPRVTRAISQCPAGHCHSRNCCAFYCSTGDTCLMMSGKPFCLGEGGVPTNANTCLESRCLDCPLSAGLYCSSTFCETLVEDPSFRVCNFDRIRGPIQP
ncbi:uncharacterized protein LOC110855476 [Folsomia candida]|uniref:Uncharacterized protein n=1 Tax=Folsomia candida TaxID=158441 RepID=A0A226DTZ4_FOLCA|nr:uncharacterized protein LOC110855476 [Folsomia candida]OXA48294.1 hypothetical protein Fcan01_16988 [Folsomia candida]